MISSWPLYSGELSLVFGSRHDLLLTFSVCFMFPYRLFHPLLSSSFLSVFVLSPPLPLFLIFLHRFFFLPFLVLPLSLFISLRLLPASSQWECYTFVLALFITLIILLTLFFPSVSPTNLWMSPFRGLGGVLSLGLLHLCPGSFCDSDQSDSQMEPLLLRPPMVGHAAPGLSSGVAAETPPHPPRLAT